MARSDWHRPQEGTFSVQNGMRRIVIELSYDGSSFCGWQAQDGQRTVQTELENTIGNFLGFPVKVSGSGRTDSGVHARMQVCHFDVPSSCTVPAKAFAHALILPPDISVSRCFDAPDGFHSRFSTMAREYRFFIKSFENSTCFDNGRAWLIKKLPDIGLLNAYAFLVKGTHDFSAFCGAGDLSLSKSRDIYESEFFFEDSPYGGKTLVYRISGNAFLYHMIRSLVGTMITLGLKNAPAEEFSDILESKDRSRALVTAKPDGLYLWRISYDKDEFMWFEKEN